MIDPNIIPSTYPFTYITMLDGTGSTMSEVNTTKLTAAYANGFFESPFNNSEKKDSKLLKIKKLIIITVATIEN